jgi:hypothetical protein
MGDVIELIGGASIGCLDGICGTLGRLIVDPSTKSVTHLSIEPMGLLDKGRLVPIGLVHGDEQGLGLDCTLAEFTALAPNAHSELQPVPGMRPGSYEVTWITLFEVPEGQVEVNGEIPILATDGHARELRGLVVDGENAQIVKLLLEIGHLTHKHEVAIPADLLLSIATDGIRLEVSKDDLAKFV